MLRCGIFLLWSAKVEDYSTGLLLHVPAVLLVSGKWSSRVLLLDIGFRRSTVCVIDAGRCIDAARQRVSSDWQEAVSYYVASRLRCYHSCS